MLLLFAGITALCLAFLELFVYALLRSRRATMCLPSGGPTGSRGGKTCSIIKEELTSVISRDSEAHRRSRIETNNGGHGLSSPPNSSRINRFGQNSNNPRTNGDILKSAGNGNGLKNGHNFYQTQALLRKDANKDEDNAQL